ncbi:GPI-anchored surface protein, putative [Bodo saltans]|uniref:GPI-anchored surface protein, putative n=1 Tax=Bodo saltans TaxID=75058 RepID=A0A0S4IL45_BODSA|nr:GPI-anchored surface protein, putative [Bodo saltans]|eukprot:CUF20262.1 GPI-anchored surface protein, putative [Bodo saltans]
MRSAGTQFLTLSSNATTARTTQIRFISWSEPTATLYGLANSNDNCVLVSIDPNTAAYTELMVYSNCVAEPMFASSSKPELYAFLSVGMGRILVRFDVSTSQASVELVQLYTDGLVVAAVARLS